MRNVKHLAAGAFAAAAVAIAISCGGSASPSTAPSASCTPSANPNTFVIMNNAICPQALTVARGSQVTIQNQDPRNHNMASDPHPEHTDCPEFASIGFLSTGQSRSSGNLNTARRCGLHDHDDPNNNALKATVTIQ